MYGFSTINNKNLLVGGTGNTFSTVGVVASRAMSAG